MADKRWIPLCTIAVVLALLAAATVWATASQEAEPLAPLAPVGTGFTYQGKLDDDGAPVNAECQMAFRLYTDAGTFAKLVGGPIVPTVRVDDGLFTVELDFGSTPFQGFARWLDIQVKCPGDHDFTDLGRRELTAVPYALYALDAAWDGLPYAGVIVVAKSGGDFTSVQAAIDSITTANADQPYLVWIAPGVYEEQVTMVPYVHLQGAGQEATVISSTVGSAADPPDQATLILANHTSLRDLTVDNSGTAAHNAALLAPDGSDDVLVADVTAQAQGAGTNNYGVFVDSANDVVLQQVTAEAGNASDRNAGLDMSSGPGMVQLDGGLFVGRGGDKAYGIRARGWLYAEGVTALGDQEGNFGDGYGLHARVIGHVELRGGSFTAAGDSSAYGIYNEGVSLEASGVIARGDGYFGFGLKNESTARLSGGFFTGFGSAAGHGYGIYNSGILTADSITALAQNAMNNNGLANEQGGQATLRGGSFTGSGGTYANGIYNQGGGAILEADGVRAVGEGASTTNYGLLNYGRVDAILRGCSFTGSGGTDAYGLYNHLLAMADVDVTQSVLEGDDYSVLDETGSGTVTVSNSRLDGSVSGTVTCVAVTEGTTWYENTCP